MSRWSVKKNSSKVKGKETPAKERKSKIAALGGFLLSSSKPILVAVIASLASLVTYVLTPFHEYVNSIVWKEKGELVVVSTHKEMHVGEVLGLNVYLISLSRSPVSEGSMKVSFDDAILRPAPETNEKLVMKSPRVVSVERLTPDDLEFIAQASGVAKFVVSVVTKNGDSPIEKAMLVKVLPKKKQIYPTAKSFTGDWNIVLNGTSGTMELEDIGRSLSGKYLLNDGYRGEIDGHHDGKTFYLTLYRHGLPTQYEVRKGVFDPANELGVELSGEAILRLPRGVGADKEQDIPANDGWTVLHKGEFTASAKGETQ